MKIGNPIDKDYLHIKRGLKVLEVGPGNNPTRRADILVEKFVDDNTHRKGDFKIFPHQKLFVSDGENLPFGDKEFDYVICSHVLEHTEDPLAFVNEQARVSKRGYIEVPSLIGEFLAPKESHKWVTLVIDRKLVLYEKSKLPYTFAADFGNLFLNFLPYKSLLYRLFNMSTQNFLVARYPWEGTVEIIVNPESDYYKSYFTEKWTPEMVSRIYPPLSPLNECRKIITIFTRFVWYKLKKTLMPKDAPLSYEEYKNSSSGR